MVSFADAMLVFTHMTRSFVDTIHSLSLVWRGVADTIIILATTHMGYRPSQIGLRFVLSLITIWRGVPSRH